MTFLLRRAAGLVLLVVVFFPRATFCHAADRYVAWQADGKKVSAIRVAAWHAPGISPRQAGQQRDDESSRLRLVRDRQAKVERKPPFLRLANGDVLTGSPVQLEPDQGRQGLAPRVRVQLEGMLPVSGTGVAVRTDRVARIVGSAAASLRQEPPPGTVELADGRRLVARAIKWREYGLAMLTAEGIVEANYPDIVDAVFPGIDIAAGVLDDNLWAGTWAGSIVRFQLASGATITASRVTREQERSRRGRRSGVELATYYYVQPAWSDQPLALPEKDIAWCSYRAADEAPLSLLSARLVRSEQLLFDGPVWDRTALADGSLAVAGEVESDLAVRTRSHSEVVFDLPPGARSLSTTVGLDRAAGGGGCVRCQIVAESAEGVEHLENPEHLEKKVLWDSGILLGTDSPKSTGPIDVAGMKRVILVTQFAHEGRPAGADPLDIRDQVVWIAPLVALDFDRSSHLLAMLAGADGWELIAGGQPAQISSRWSLLTASWESVVVLPAAAELKLRRRLDVSAANEIVELLTSCPLEIDEHDFRLTVGGQMVEANPSADLAVLKQRVRNLSDRLRQNSDSYLSDELAYWWDLSAWRGREVTLELTLRGGSDRNEVVWRGLALRSAVANLAADGKPLAFDVPLTSLVPSSVTSPSSRARPVKDGLPEGRNPPPIRFLGKTFTGGYGLARDSSVTFELAPEHRRFVAIAGCPTFVAGPLQVLLDGQVVWERPFMLGLEPAEQIDIPIPAGAKTLTLQTGPESSYTGFAAWANAGFVTK